MGAIKPLEELMEAAHLHGDEEQWRALCETRFGLTVQLLYFPLCFADYTSVCVLGVALFVWRECV